MKKNKANLKSLTFMKILLLIFIPISILTVYLLLFYKINTTYYIKELNKKYEQQLEYISKNTDDLLYTFLHLSINLSEEETFKKLSDETQFYNKLEFIAKLRKTRTYNINISDIHYYNFGSNIMYNTEGSCSLDKFFSDYFIDNSYEETIKDLSSLRSSFKILPEIKMFNKYERTYVAYYPIFISGFGRLKQEEKIVILIKTKDFKNLINITNITPNSNIILMDTSGSFMLQSSEASASSSSSFSTENLSSFKKNLTSLADHSILIRYSSKHTLLQSLVYFAYIPYRDITSNSNYIQYNIIIILVILTASIMGVFIAFKIYYPVTFIKNRLGAQTDVERPLIDDYQYINNKIDSIINDKNQLHDKLQNILPKARERYLIELLYQGDYSISENEQEFLRNNGIDFKHKCFCVAILKILYTDDFPLEQKNHIYNVILHKIKNDILTDMISFTISLNNNKICIIFNSGGNRITEILKYLKTTSVDIISTHLSLDMHVSIGNTHMDYDGLHLSFKEAENTLHYTNSSKKIVQYCKNNPVLSIFNLESISQLKNLLVQGQLTDVPEYIHKILQDATYRPLQQSEIRSLYISVIKNTEQSLKELNINTNSFNEFCLLIENPSTILSIQEFEEYYCSVLQNIAYLGKQRVKKININFLIDYINSHFDEELYLDMFAQQLNITPQYLSKIFKQEFQVSFYDYISACRINHAKLLLVQTNFSLDDIANKCGFNSRHTFIRMFKKHEIITPTEFRNINA